ncbi:MAG TPA: hypothetical protein VIX13_03240, partial [Candidatus Eisenbacteria bacterium]
MEVMMKPSSSRWSLIGIAAGALCLALAATPALANPPDDEEDSNPQTKKEIRVYKGDDDNDVPSDRVRKETRVRGND